MSIYTSYKQLLARVKDVMLLGSVKTILSWDMDTYLPPGAVGQRGDQFEFLQGVMHQWETAPAIGRLLAEIQASTEFEDFGEIDRRNVFLINRHYTRQIKMPPDLVKALAKAKPPSNHAWKMAKKARDFAAFEPYLEQMVDLARKKAEILGDGRDPYDVLLDLYEPGMTADQLDALFAPLKAGIIPLVRKYAGEDNSHDFSFLQSPVPFTVQKAIGKAESEFIGVDQERSRVDETEHPFSIGYYDDIRIAVHYYEDNPTAALFALLHEGGHSLYDQNIPFEWRWTPVGFACSLGVHESQARFLENMVGKGPEFWDFFYPRLQEMAGGVFQDVPREAFLQAVNEVKPTKIRMEADEVTYSLHVILRFEIEQALLREEANVAELPQLWNEKMDEYLGLAIDHDAEGVLQDAHWAGGSFGYFPTYALGNIYGGMFVQSLDQAVPNWREAIAKGDFAPARAWLIDHVYHLGNLYNPVDLVRHVTGQEVSPDAFLHYLEGKFATIYQF
ncbi:MAG TPA: carboxypeptidase M32 [Candidatus Lokiarchaeia archaeon]|nr:carboxypeptidase M32 [Candidatus Lokiarchaeia archaeon]